MRIDREHHFKKQFSRLPSKIKEQFRTRIIVFLKNPYADILNNHKLQGEYAEYRSINITGNVRLIYKEVTKEYVIFAEIGTHSQLYE